MVTASPRDTPVSTVGAVLAVFVKDWRTEWRTRAALNSIALFAVASPVALSFTVARQVLAPETLGGMLWTVLLFAALVGLGRSFVKEEESGTATLLRLNFSSDSVLWGKALFNLSLLTATQLAAVPLFALMLDARIKNWPLLGLTLAGGDVGLAVTATLLGAIAARARARGALFGAIALPLLLPLLVAAAAATAACLTAPPGLPTSREYWPSMQMICAYDVVMVAAVYMLFGFVWRD